MKILEVTIKKIWGNRVIYPANEAAHHFARVARTKTLTPQTLRQAQLMGYEIHEVYHPQLDEVLK
jgi:hypothetical protein